MDGEIKRLVMEEENDVPISYDNDGTFTDTQVQGDYSKYGGSYI